MKHLKKWMVVFACLSILVQAGSVASEGIQTWGMVHEETDVM